MKKQWIALLLVGVLLLGACSKAPAETQTPSETPAETPAESPVIGGADGPTDIEILPWNEEHVAKVGDEYLSRKTYNALVALNKYIFISQYGEEVFKNEEQDILSALKKATLDDFVTGALVTKLTKDRGLSPNEEEIARIEGEFKASLEEDEALAVFFEGEGAEPEDLLPYIRMQSNFGVLLDSFKEEVLQSQEYADTLEGTELVRARHILLDGEDEEAAKELLEEVKKAPETFADVAMQKSLDPGSGSLGGELGYFGMADMVPEFGAASFGAEIGEIVMTRSQFGFHIIEVLDRGTITQLEEKGLADEVAGSKAKLLDPLISSLYQKEYARMLEEHPVEYYALEKNE